MLAARWQAKSWVGGQREARGVTSLTSWQQTPPAIVLTNWKKRFWMTAEISNKVRALVQGGTEAPRKSENFLEKYNFIVNIILNHYVIILKRNNWY